jgi:hypothetical protein
VYWFVNLQNNKRCKGCIHVSSCQRLENTKVEMVGIPKECAYVERRVTVRKEAGGGLQAKNTKCI